MITDISQLDLSKEYNYKDYLTWKFKERVELWKGKLLKMSPAPSRKHQKVVGEFYRVISNHLHETNSLCHWYVAPFDVRLPVSFKENEISTVVQPDLCLICDERKLDDQGCNGAPDLVVEVLSPGNAPAERKHKFNLYQEAGVKEYWMVHPTEETVVVYTLSEQNKYIGSRFFLVDDTVKSKIISGFSLQLENLFNG